MLKYITFSEYYEPVGLCHPFIHSTTICRSVKIYVIGVVVMDITILTIPQPNFIY